MDLVSTKIQLQTANLQLVAWLSRPSSMMSEVHFLTIIIVIIVVVVVVAVLCFMEL